MTDETDDDDDLSCGWPPCQTPDCEYGVCLWADTGLCFPCSERLIGREELIRRFNATHDMTWEEAISADEQESDA